MRTLNRTIESFSFFEREKEKGKTISNKCGRDFLYYALTFYHPGAFNNLHLNPKRIDEQGLFGRPMKDSLAWTQIQFAKVSSYLNSIELKLYINDREIKGYLSFVSAILFSRQKFEAAIETIEAAIDANEAVGVDISLGMFGLMDHVLFVYGYDADNVYVFDTHKVPHLEYENYNGNAFCFVLPKAIIEKRWTTFGRIWKVKN